jgi:hypothetical protein
MKRILIPAALGALSLLAACGPANDIAVTGDNNVVLNDAHANYAFTNDDEASANEMGPELNQLSNGVEAPANATP